MADIDILNYYKKKLKTKHDFLEILLYVVSFPAGDMHFNHKIKTRTSLFDIVVGIIIGTTIGGFTQSIKEHKIKEIYNKDFKIEHRAIYSVGENKMSDFIMQGPLKYFSNGRTIYCLLKKPDKTISNLTIIANRDSEEIIANYVFDDVVEPENITKEMLQNPKYLTVDSHDVYGKVANKVYLDYIQNEFFTNSEKYDEKEFNFIKDLKAVFK